MVSLNSSVQTPMQAISALLPIKKRWILYKVMCLLPSKSCYGHKMFKISVIGVKIHWKDCPKQIQFLIRCHKNLFHICFRLHCAKKTFILIGVFSNKKWSLPSILAVPGDRVGATLPSPLLQPPPLMRGAVGMGGGIGLYGSLVAGSIREFSPSFHSPD